MTLADTSIFLDINLPNATTWFYFSGLLAVALFFKFSRFLSMRNLDVVSLYLFMPGLLLLADTGFLLPERAWNSLQAAGVPENVLSKLDKLKNKEHKTREELDREIALVLDAKEREQYLNVISNAVVTGPAFWGYLWLMIASLFFLVRCFVDLALVRRPALSSNLDLAGLIWLAGALFVSLIAVAIRQPGPPATAEESARTPIGDLPRMSEKVITTHAPTEVDETHLSLWVERGWELLCHLSVVVGLALIGWRHFEDPRAGMSAATFFLLLPYTFLLLPGSPLGIGRWDHAWPMALVVWAIFAYRRPMLAGALLGVAAIPFFFLIVTLPAWSSFYFRRGVGRFLLSFVLSLSLGLALFGGLRWLSGELPSSRQSQWTRLDWLPWQRPDPATQGFWQDIPSQSVTRMHGVYRVPIFIASIALIVIAGVWPYPKNLAHVLALSAAALISIQFWYADRGGIYVLWYLPLLLLLVFRPNLSSCQPPPPCADDWLARLGGRLVNLVLRLLRRPLSIEKVA